MKRKVSRRILNDAAAAECFGAVFCGLTDFRIDFTDHIRIYRTDIAFIDNLIRNGVDRVSAVIDDAVQTHHIFIAEGFPQHIDGTDEQRAFMERIDALLRECCRMARFSEEGNLLINKAAQHTAETEAPVLVRHCMNMNQAVDIVEHMFCQHVLLAGTVGDLPFFHKTLTVFHIRKFLRGRKEQGHGSCRTVGIVFQRCHHPQHDSDLGGMTACMRRRCKRICAGMSLRRYRIQFRNQTDMRSALADRHGEAGQRIFPVDLQIMPVKKLLNGLFCFSFLKSKFRMMEQFIAKRKQFLRMRINIIHKII